MVNGGTTHRCPHCRERRLETAATLPYVRGSFRAGQFGMRTIAGCAPCVRRQLLFHTADASLNGWTSFAGLIANPVMIVYGLCRALIVMKNPARVDSLLHAAGMSGGESPPGALKIAYRLAAALIAADDKILPQEITAAATIGRELFPGFDETEFLQTVKNRNALPQAGELAALLGTALDDDGRAAVYRYLVAIATADADVAPEERTLLKTVAANLRIGGAGSGVDASA